MKNFSRFAPIFVFVAIFLIDLASKYFVESTLPLREYYYPIYPYGGIGVFENFLGIEFSINHQINRGAAWGILHDWQIYLVFLRIGIVSSIIGYILFFNKHKTWELPLAFIVAGASGNIIDYFLYGHVIDMFHFILWGYDYPVFNVADAAIFIGIAWLFILSFLEPKNSQVKTKIQG